MLPHRLVRRAVAAALGAALLSSGLVTPTPAGSTASPALSHTSTTSAASTTSERRTNPGRGVSTWWMPDGPKALHRARVSWVYNWWVYPSYRVPSDVQYVPMIWGPQFLTPQTLAVAKTHGPDLLTFNEPELGSQANLSVSQAIGLWPYLESTGMRLSSPAVTTDALDPKGWLGRFMRRADRTGLRVDFIALHCYSGQLRTNTVANLRRYLVAVHRRYGRPIWLTEFAIAAHDGLGKVDYPRGRVQARFVRDATRMLDSLPFVERYAWFALPAPERGRSSGLFRPDLRPTPAGRAYRQRPAAG